MAGTTAASRLASATLQRLIAEGTGYRAGAVIITYAEGDGVNVAHALGMRAGEDASDLLLLAHRFRSLATELETLIHTVAEDGLQGVVRAPTTGEGEASAPEPEAPASEPV